MSSIVRISRAFARPVVCQRAFGTTSWRALKESDRHHPDQATHNETHKQDGLKKQKEGKGEWKRELASDSEEAVNADRYSGSIEELQKQTAEEAAKKK